MIQEFIDGFIAGLGLWLPLAVGWIIVFGIVYAFRERFRSRKTNKVEDGQ